MVAAVTESDLWQVLMSAKAEDRAVLRWVSTSYLIRGPGPLTGGGILTTHFPMHVPQPTQTLQAEDHWGPSESSLHCPRTHPPWLGASLGDV